MSRIVRKFQKIFASGATNNGVFGSGQDGTKVLSLDPDTLQSKPAFLTGWLDAILGAKDFPPLEEFQSLNYINTYQLAYLFQEGVPEWDVSTTYFQHSIVKKTGTYELYGSIGDNNTGHALPVSVSDANWQFLIDLSINSKIPYGVTTNIGNVYSVTTSPVFATFNDGFAFLFRANASNTSATQINPNSIGNKDLYVDGVACVGGEIVAGVMYMGICNNTSSRVDLVTASLIQATTTKKGVAATASNAMALAGTDTATIITPAGLVAAFSDKNIATSGYQKFPGGLIIQWDTVSISGGAGTWTYPKVFPNTALMVLAGQDSTNLGIQVAAKPDPANLTTKALLASQSMADSFYVLAIGY